MGQQIEVKILRVDREERKIGLSRKRVEWAEEAQERGAAASAPSIPPAELRGGVGRGSGPLIQPSRGRSRGEEKEKEKDKG